MEAEMCNFIKACTIVSASLTYCYFISSRIPKGMIRLLFFIPIICIFILVPFLLSTVFFQLYIGLFIAWLANFKLLLIAFGHDDPLSTDPSIPLLHFILVISLPIEIKRKYGKNNEKDDLKSPIKFVLSTLTWCLMVQMYVKKTYILSNYPIVSRCLYTCELILQEQIMFAVVAAIAKRFINRELEPQFADPHLSRSVQNFWGKRWNLMTTSILKSTVYVPTRSLFTPILGRRWAIHPAILATFAVSGLMHEMFYFYAGRQWPTWEVMWFFIINGAWVAIEIEVKKKASKSGWRLHPKISRPLTLGFIAVTGVWLCCTELVHCGVDVREMEEYAALLEYMKHILRNTYMKIFKSNFLEY